MNRTEVNRFICLVFGITKSPFTLDGKLKVHVNKYKFLYPELIENTRDDIYVNDLVLGRNVLSSIKETKQKSIEFLAKVRLNKLH